MSDRVPIPTLPGLAEDLVDVDLILAGLGASARISRVFLARSGAGAGVLTASVRNATGGGGSGIAVAFGANDASAVGTGSLEVASGDSIYLRISAADAISQDLRGWFEVTGPTGITTGALTNLARVKELLGQTSSQWDALISNVIAGVSARMQGIMGRKILAESIAGELHDGPRGDTLELETFPILTPGSVVVRLNGTLVDTAEYVVRAGPAHLVAVSNGESSAWERGRLNYSVDYDAGFDEVPEDLVLAATRQSAFVALEAMHKDRLGSRATVLDAGGSAEFITTEWLSGVLATLEAYGNRRLA